MAQFKQSESKEGTGYLDGQMLIAMPSMGDPRFERAVVFLCAHSADGAMGIVVNKLVSGINFPELLDQLEIDRTTNDTSALERINVHFGGPVETARGFVLHSSDYHSESSSMPIGGNISLTATVDILRSIAAGDGPDRALMALGYAGWAAGQLEEEIQSNGWLHCHADDSLLFAADVNTKYEQALAKIGVDLSLLVGDAGHA